MKKIFLLIVLALTGQTIKAQSDAFISTWVTTTGFETLTLPAQPDAPNYTINWGDGFTNTYTAIQTPSHTFVNSGEHTLSFTGTFPHLELAHINLKAVQQWGTQKWTSMAYMFKSCNNLNSIPIQAPDLTLCTDMSYMFYSAKIFNQPIGNWDVSQVTDMSFMFSYASSFNQPIGNWDVSQVTDMSSMFSASSFNQSIGNWNVKKVTNMSSMFSLNTPFNQPIGNWDVGNVSNMSNMFSSNPVFNQPIGTWNVNKVTNMSAMFNENAVFNQPIGNWDVSQVTNMVAMFGGAISFNQPIGTWNVNKVTNMIAMFNSAPAFNQSIENWDVSQVTDMSYMFVGAISFNQPIGNWNVSQVTDMVNMFDGVKLSITNYDNLLNGWASKGMNGSVLKSGVTFSGGNSTYCNSSSSRDYLIKTYKWVISDAGVNCTGLDTEAFDKSNVSLYPNPTSSVLNIKVDDIMANQPYTISDALGKIVLKGKLNEGNTNIDVEHLSKGIYYFKVSDKNASKFIKE